MRLTRENVMPTYGLDDYDLVEGSSPAMLAALDKAIQDEQPIVVTLWRPHWAFTKYDIKALEDPDGAFGDPDTLQAIAGPDFADQNPEVAKWLSNFTLTSEQLGSLELLIQQKGQGNEQEAAKEWITQNEDVVDSWLS
jgi:glycine betaine/proline transport system substrate-binding protein